MTSVVQDPNISSKTQLLAGATGCAFDPMRDLAFVASEYAKSFAVFDVSVSPPRVIGQVRHPLLSGEAIQYDSTRQRAFVVSRRDAAMLVVNVGDPTEPAVVGIFSSKPLLRDLFAE